MSSNSQSQSPSPRLVPAPSPGPPPLPPAPAVAAPPPASKRAAPDNASDRASKRRSSRACLSCRARKVRCDVASGGTPCTNCRLDEVQCILKESNRGRKASGPVPITHSSPAAAPTCNEHGEHGERDAPEDTIAVRPRVDHSHEQFVTLSFEDQPRPSLVVGLANEQRPHDQSSLGDITTPASSHGHHHDSHPPSVDPGPRCLPLYIRPLPPHIKADDFEYLARKDALTIPDTTLRDELLRTYVNIVHPFVPAIDLEDFLCPILAGDERNSVSLLLFQAVMFASVTFVDADLLRHRGYRNRKVARKAFFRRARLLYGLDCEPDRIALIQALLLMTYWYDSPDDEKDTWHWMGITLSLAQVAGIHRDPAHLKLSPRDKGVRCRLWWSCYMRDRLLALGIHRPARIRDEDYNVPMLSLDHFYLDAPSEPLIALLGESCFTIPDPDARKAVAGMCVELAKLSVIIGHILHSQYSVLLTNLPIGSESLMKVVVTPTRSEKQSVEMVKCDAELNAWLEKLDARSRYTPLRLRSTETNDGPTMIIRYHQALLHMLYLTALGVLHRPQIFSSNGEYPVSSFNRKLSRQRVTEAAIEMTKLAYDLQQHNQLRFLSTSSVPAFLSATLIHLLDIRSPDEEIRNISIGRFYQCLQALHQLQDMYASADFAVSFLENLRHSLDVQIPMLNLQPLSTAADPSSTKAIPSPPLHGIEMFNGHSATYLPLSNPRDRPSLPDFSPMRSNGPSVDIVQPLCHPLNPFDTLPPGNGSVGNTQQFDNHVGVSPQPDAWNDIENLLPALINFEADPNWFISNQEALKVPDSVSPYDDIRTN